MLNFPCIDSHVEITKGNYSSSDISQHLLVFWHPSFNLCSNNDPACSIKHRIQKCVLLYTILYLILVGKFHILSAPPKKSVLQCIAAAFPFFNSTRNILPPSREGSPQRIFSRQNSVEILFEAQRFYLGLEWSWSHVVRNAITTLKFTNLNLTLESFSNKHGGCLLILVIIFHLKWVEVKSPHLPSVHIILSIVFFILDLCMILPTTGELVELIHQTQVRKVNYHSIISIESPNLNHHRSELH